MFNYYFIWQKNLVIRYAGVFLIFFFFIGTSGCDKIPFLSKFFPSLGQGKKEEVKTPAQIPPPSISSQNVLARVGGWTLTPEAFEEKLKDVKELLPDFNITDRENRKTILEELIRQQLLIQDAEHKGLAQKEDIVKAIEELRNTLIVQEAVTNLTKDISVTPEEVRDYYNQNRALFTEPAEYHIREIVVLTQAEANEILIELLKGADFAETAKLRSKSASASKGGDLGFIQEFKFPQLETALATLEVGALSNVFKGPDGYYIIKLEEKKGGGLQDFASVSEDIKEGLLLMKQQQAVLRHIDELKQKTTVEINENLLGG